MKVAIGGDRLGSGAKMNVNLREYNRSTHDLGYIWRSTMAAGTLVPCIVELAQPGDTWDIDLDAMVLTHPTVGPLFGSYKLQLDVFMCPLRLYNAQLHNNALNVGMKMDTVKFPQIKLKSNGLDWTKPVDNQQINPSSIFKYLGISGLGNFPLEQRKLRYFDATEYLSYWDVVKNYYANKQEEKGAVIHNTPNAPVNSVLLMVADDPTWANPKTLQDPSVPITISDPITVNTVLTITYITGQPPIPETILVEVVGGIFVPITYVWNSIVDDGTDTITCTDVANYISSYLRWWRMATGQDLNDGEPKVYMFPLENIDTMRELILQKPKATALIIDENSPEPYNLPFLEDENGIDWIYSKMSTQEGLALKTYQSDLFNNWIQTEWIDGTGGIADLTAVDVTGGSFTMDQLNLSQKLYEMYNRVALAGGSYKDWIEVSYTSNIYRGVETPMYMGGLSKELIFDEVISNSQTESQPLGTLAGRGKLNGKHKGGRIKIKTEEHAIIMGIISLTPRIDYSQGNRWFTNLKNMGELHVPALDEIGFQDLITDKMASWDTEITGSSPNFVTVYKSAGKQPAWIDYMTNYNRTYGNFAIQDNEMFMTLNRRYEQNPTTESILDLTTYVDPAKYNYIFAETNRDAQNFWTQLKIDIECRRVMSAKVIPNL